MATLVVLKLKLFCSKSYDVITSVYDVASRISSADSNYIVDVIMWPKFGKLS